MKAIYSIFKRGMKGIYQHCQEKHLHRYLAEFDFRYSNRVRLGVNDVARAERALTGIVGKRLTYRNDSPKDVRGMAQAKREKAKPKPRLRAAPELENREGIPKLGKF